MTPNRQTFARLPSMSRLTPDTLHTNDTNKFEEWRLSVGGDHAKLIEEGETDLDQTGTPRGFSTD